MSKSVTEKRQEDVRYLLDTCLFRQCVGAGLARWLITK